MDGPKAQANSKPIWSSDLAEIGKLLGLKVPSASLNQLPHGFNHSKQKCGFWGLGGIEPSELLRSPFL